MQTQLQLSGTEAGLSWRSCPATADAGHLHGNLGAVHTGLHGHGTPAALVTTPALLLT